MEFLMIMAILPVVQQFVSIACDWIMIEKPGRDGREIEMSLMMLIFCPDMGSVIYMY